MDQRGRAGDRYLGRQAELPHRLTAEVQDLYERLRELASRPRRRRR